MMREEFVAKLDDIKKNDMEMSYSEIRMHIHQHARGEEDIPVCIGELSELSLELTRYQRGKMDKDDFLQELSHVQWAIWSLQDKFGVTDNELMAAVQASFR